MASGDESALGEAFDQFGPSVHALASRILGIGGDADEILQDVFLNLWKRAAQFDAERGSLLGYLLTIARTAAIDRLRRRRARPDAESPAPPPELDANIGVPLDLLSIEDGRVLVIEALASLPAEERLVIELAYFEGLSQSEIAEKTKTPLGTVKGRARNALRRLRERLPRGLGGDG
jgi:RNA polymerase sigma-70 factor (ECF subfamily)